MLHPVNSSLDQDIAKELQKLQQHECPINTEEVDNACTTSRQHKIALLEYNESTQPTNECSRADKMLWENPRKLSCISAL